MTDLRMSQSIDSIQLLPIYFLMLIMSFSSMIFSLPVAFLFTF